MVMDDYLRSAADLIEYTPEDIIFHRVTGTSPRDVLLAPEWCQYKWIVLNGLEATLRERGTRQGSRAHLLAQELKHVA